MENTTEYQREWRKDNPEKARAIQDRYYAKHREKIIQAAKSYRKNRSPGQVATALEKRRKRDENSREKINKRQREWRAENYERLAPMSRVYYLRHKHKKKAGRKLRYAVEKGLVVKPGVCECCKKRVFVEGHHEDYDKPLDAQWLCKKCHEEIHHCIQDTQS